MRENEYYKEFLDMDSQQKISWAVGQIAISLGDGTLREAMWRVLDRTFRSGVYLGKKLAKEEMKNESTNHRRAR